MADIERETDPYPSATNVPITPTSWFRDEIVEAVKEPGGIVQAAIDSIAKIKTVNGSYPDAWGNINVPPGEITPMQVQQVLLSVIRAGDNVHVDVDPTSGQVIIHAHNIGSVWTVNGKSGHISIDKHAIGLGRVENTSDMEKPISTATRAAIDQLSGELRTLIETTRNTLNTRITNEVNALTSRISSEVTRLTNLIAGKANINHKHSPSDITGLDHRISEVSLNNWGSWQPIALRNGWSSYGGDTAMAVTNGRFVALRGKIRPGSNVIFGNLPMGFPSSSREYIAFGTHVTKDATTGTATRPTKIFNRSSVLSVNGYASIVPDKPYHDLTGALYVIL